MGGWTEACTGIQTQGRSLRTDLNTHLTRYLGGATPTPRKNEAVFSPPPKIKLALGAESPCLPTCISQERPILINLFLAHRFVSRRIPSVKRHKGPEPQQVQTSGGEKAGFSLCRESLGVSGSRPRVQRYPQRQLGSVFLPFISAETLEGQRKPFCPVSLWGGKLPLGPQPSTHPPTPV